MPETSRTYAQLLALFPDNTTGLISPEDLRDFLKTLEQYVRGQNTSETGSVVHEGTNSAAAFTIKGRGASPAGATGTGAVVLRLVSVNDAETDAFRVYRSLTHLTNNQASAWMNARGGYVTNAEVIISGNHQSSGVNSLFMTSIKADVPVALEIVAGQVEAAKILSLISGEAQEKAIFDYRAEPFFYAPGVGLVCTMIDGKRVRARLDNNNGAGPIAWVLEELETGLKLPVGITAANGSEFNGAASTTSPGNLTGGQTPTTYGSTWGLTGTGQAYCFSGTFDQPVGAAAVWDFGAGSGDGTYEWDIWRWDLSSRCHFRNSNGSNGWWVSLTSQSLSLWKCVAGTSSQVGPTRTVHVSNYERPMGRVKVVTLTNAITVYWNGIKAIEVASDSFNATAQRSGIGHQNGFAIGESMCFNYLRKA